MVGGRAFMAWVVLAFVGAIIFLGCSALLLGGGL